MALSVLKLWIKFVETHSIIVLAVILSMIALNALKLLFDSLRKKDLSLLRILMAQELPLIQIFLRRITIAKEGSSVGVTSNCQDCKIYVSLLNENTLTHNQGILQSLHENRRHGKLRHLVINEFLNNLILSRHSFSINYLMVNYG